MSMETIEQDFHDKVCSKVRLVAEGMERYRVFTPFLFEDGDHLSIVLKKEGTRWELSDEAHTYFSDVCEKQFSSLSANRERITQFVEESLSR